MHIDYGICDSTIKQSVVCSMFLQAFSTMIQLRFASEYLAGNFIFLMNSNGYEI